MNQALLLVVERIKPVGRINMLLTKKERRDVIIP